MTLFVMFILRLPFWQVFELLQFVSYWNASEALKISKFFFLQRFSRTWSTITLQVKIPVSLFVCISRWTKEWWSSDSYPPDVSIIFLSISHQNLFRSDKYCEKICARLIPIFCDILMFIHLANLRNKLLFCRLTLWWGEMNPIGRLFCWFTGILVTADVRQPWMDLHDYHFEYLAPIIQYSIPLFT